MNPQKVYLVMGPDDELLGEADTLEDAVRGAEDLGYPEVVVDQTLTEGFEEDEDLRPNIPRTAEEAWDIVAADGGRTGVTSDRQGQRLHLPLVSEG